MTGVVTGEMLAGIKESSFRNRFLHEQATVRGWSDKLRQAAPTVLDYGCGQGIGALGLALHEPHAQVDGVDMGPYFDVLARVTANNLGCGLPDNLRLQTFNGYELPFEDGRFDLVYSWSVFEHIRRDLLGAVLTEIRRVMRPNGHLFIQIDPLYFSPRGAHLYQCSPTPWVHLLLQHDRLRDLVQGCDAPQASRARLWEQYETLNRITVGELRAVVQANEFEIVRLQVDKCDLEAPQALLEIYQRDVLETSTVYLLARAPS